MDFLQVGLMFLILVLGAMLSILGIQVFFILKSLKASLDRFERILNNTETITEELEKPARAVADAADAVENGVKAAKALIAKSAKPAKRLFIRR